MAPPNPKRARWSPGIVRTYERMRTPRTKLEAKIWTFFLKASTGHDFLPPRLWPKALDVVYDFPNPNAPRGHKNRFGFFLRLLTDLGVAPKVAAHLTGYYPSSTGRIVFDDRVKSVLMRNQMVRDANNPLWAAKYWRRYWDTTAGEWIP